MLTQGLCKVSLILVAWIMCKHQRNSLGWKVICEAVQTLDYSVDGNKQIPTRGD